jgi:DNA mismatch repair protein MutS
MAGKDTPMMRQYLEAEAAHPGALVLMRMGDFYECFAQHAQDLARITGVTLTSRNKDDPEPLPMAGVPHHQLANYLPKLLAAGRRVAVVDQLEDPAQAKGLVRRGVTRVVSAGTLIDEDSLAPGDANWLVAVTGFDTAQPVGLAALDCSTGRFQVDQARDPHALAVALARWAPSEIVLPEHLARDPATGERLGHLLAPAATPPLANLGQFAWDGREGRRFLAERLGVVALDGFGIGPGEDHLCAAAAACLRYAEGSARPDGGGGLAHIRGLVRISRDEHAVLDAACRRTLDLVRNSRDGGRDATLLAAVDRTRTAPGARLLAEWLVRPLRGVEAIRDRHDAVQFLLDDQRRDRLRTALADIYDLERLAARIATGRAGPRDLAWLATSCAAAVRVGAALGDGLPPLLARAAAHLDPCPAVVAELRRVLVDEPPLAVAEGGLVRDGIDPQLDELRLIRRDAGAWLTEYQRREAERLGQGKLKVGYNSVFGYYIELSKAQAERAPADYIRKQTLVNAERFITPELKEFEDKALGAEEKSKAIEARIFAGLRDLAQGAIPEVQAAAAALATVDVLAGFAEVARRQGWVRPEVDDGLAIAIEAGRHPVVEAAIGRGRFVPNDIRLDGGAHAGPRLAVITGPNMAGKSTYIRQVALLAILAQAGAYVPATAARIGVVDRVFTRIGAGDELARNLSTFMVEMSETAAILNHATERSLVVLDEVGRGTSTFDGLSLAWAICEHLHGRIRARALFATHYHELTALADRLPGIGNLTVAVAEQDGQVVFLHRIEPGAAAKSYGIHVAQLAGVPAPVLRRAQEVLRDLEAGGHGPAQPAAPATPIQTTLFGLMASPTVDRLRQLDLDDCTPRQALALLQDLQERARSEA